MVAMPPISFMSIRFLYYLAHWVNKQHFNFGQECQGISRSIKASVLPTHLIMISRVGIVLPLRQATLFKISQRVS